MESYLKGLELFRTRRKRAVILIMGKALRVLFVMITKGEIKIVRRLEMVEGNQKILAQAAGESVSILNVTSLYLAQK